MYGFFPYYFAYKFYMKGDLHIFKDLKHKYKIWRFIIRKTIVKLQSLSLVVIHC